MGPDLSGAGAERGGQPQPVLRSVLDRLVDDEPDRTVDPPVNRTQLLREHRESVLRDLGNLLNTRRAAGEIPAALEDLVPSLADYGLRDFVADGLATAQSRADLRKSIERAILLYEPRFKRVDVRVFQTSPEDGDPALRVRIDALLHAEPAPISVAFDTVIDPVSGSFGTGGTAR